MIGPIHAQKRALRERMKAARRALPPEQVLQMAAQSTERLLALPELQAAQGICCYVAVRGEHPTLPLIRALLQRGILVAVPRLSGTSGQMQARLLRDLDALVPGAFGVPTSEGPPVSALQICITPGLAFTAEGHRLGYGGGYYDRFLSANPHIRPIGLAFDLQVVPSLPTDPHDHPMDTVITPTRALRCR